MKKIILLITFSFAIFTNAQKVEVKKETVGNITKIDHYAQAKNDLYDIMQVVKLDNERQEIVFNTLISKYEFLNENQATYNAAELKTRAKDFSVKLPRVFSEQEVALIKNNKEVYLRVFE
jgi:hypothetical protein